MNTTISLTPIGYVHSPRAEIEDDNWGEIISQIVLTDGYDAEALQGIENFSHAEIIFYFNRVKREKIVTGARYPRGQQAWGKIGIFAQRGKNRPNQIGLTTVRILQRDGKVLHVQGLDAIHGTPVLDIKPVMKEFLPRGDVLQPTWVDELMRNYWDSDTVK